MEATMRPTKRCRNFFTTNPSQQLALFYEMGEELGRGHFGVVRRCIHKHSGKPFACKTISKSHLQDVHTEIAIMTSLSGHPHILRLYDVLQDDSSVHLIVDLCSGGDLFDRIQTSGPFSEQHAAFFMRRLIEAIDFCHSMGVIHADLKLENVLLADATFTSPIKVADFGLSLFFEQGQTFSEVVGTPTYIAPEVLDKHYGKEIDIWSAGVILFILLSGQPPFWGESKESIYESIKKAKLDFDSSAWDNISESAKDLVRGMICLDVGTRLTTTGVLRHPWMLLHTSSSGDLYQYDLHSRRPMDKSACGGWLSESSEYIPATKDESACGGQNQDKAACGGWISESSQYPEISPSYCPVSAMRSDPDLQLRLGLPDHEDAVTPTRVNAAQADCHKRKHTSPQEESWLRLHTGGWNNMPVELFAF